MAKKKIHLRTKTVKKYPRRNSEAGARAMYQLFHGRPSQETLVVEDNVREHGWLAGLGELVELKFVSASTDGDGNPYLVTVEFDGNRPQLCANEQGNQMYIEGGDKPTIDLAEFEMDSPEWYRDSMILGVLVEITYETEKEFHQFELIEYYHQVGEESGILPSLILDTLNTRLQIAGGQYQIRWEGIVN